MSINLKADTDYYAGKITINGEEQENSSTNPQLAYISAPISNGMIVSATDAAPIPTVPFTDVSLTMTGQGTQWLTGHMLMTTKQSPESPKIVGVGALENGSRKGLLFLLDEENDMQVAKLNLRQGQEYRIPQNCSMRKMMIWGS